MFSSAEVPFQCLLVGAGTWLTGAPAPVWFPAPTAWAVMLLAAGLALVPVWRCLADYPTKK